MAVPDFQQFMLPVLQVLGSGEVMKPRAVYCAAAKHFKLSEEEISELLPSGAQTKVVNRAGWALTYLKNAGLVDSPSRGLYQINEVGLGVLRSGPAHINLEFLRRFPKFIEFQKRSRSADDTESVAADKLRPSDLTPEEELERGYAKFRSSLQQELLDRVRTMPPDAFERLVVQLMLKLGYGGTFKEAGKAIGKSGDGGIDGIIKEDMLGLDVIYLQAKRWEASVGRPTLQQFAGSLMGKRARKGVIITTSEFTREAEEYAESIDQKISLIDGELLTDLMIDHGLGVSETKSYSIRKVDEDFFSDL
jgi:restriction system protein